MNFESPFYASLLVLVLLLIVRSWYLFRWKKRAQSSFADPQLAKKIFSFSNIGQFLRSNFLLILSVFLMILALMDLVSPGEEQEVEIQGADVVYCLDLSNSMNAEDIAPSRLDKAKLIIESTLEKTASDRVGLVVFAHNAYRVMPLTQDYEAMTSYLNAANTDYIRSQGTRFEEAVKTTQTLFKKEDLTSKNIVFLSDGEDQTDDIEKAIELAQAHKMRIITVGIGTTKGSVIPEKKKYQDTGLLLDEDKNPVISKLNDTSLKEMASATGGKYFYGDNTDQVSTQIRMALQEKADSNSQLDSAYVAEHHFQWFLGLALLLLIIVSLTNIRTEFNI